MEELLKELRLSGREISIYHYLLRCGGQTAGVIAKRLGINRSSLYAHLERLCRLGVVLVVQKNGVREFSAIAAESLLLKLQRKQSILTRKIQLAEEELSKFAKAQGLTNVEQKVKYYAGDDGLLQVLDNVLLARPEVLQAYISKEFNNYINLKAPDYPKQRTKRNIMVKAIYPFGDELGTWQSAPELKRLSRTVSSSYDVELDVLNYGTTTAVVAAGEKFAFSVDSAVLNRVQNNLFQLAWRLAKAA